MLKRRMIVYCVLMFCCSANAQNSGRIQFDDDWKFYRGAAQGAEQPAFDDADWRKIDLPHDWSIEDLPGTTSPFNRNAISQVSGGFTTGGTGWYRKNFTVSPTDKGKKIQLVFDGVYMNADVWINGKQLGNHPYGYTGFTYDITNHVSWDGPNTIALEVKNEGQNSRWYSGSGIYRHVWLRILEPVHASQWGSYITTPAISKTAATVNCKTTVINESPAAAEVKVVTKIMNGAGLQVAISESRKQLSSKQILEFSQDVAITSPQLWSLETPVLYSAVITIYNNEKLLSTDTSHFGIRTILFDITNGFQLNGKTVKLKGGCFHHDNGPLGSKAYDRAEERKVELLKASGYNAIRCSHNPPSPAFLEACDRLGMLIIDESFDMWNYGKNPYDYHLYFKDWWKKDIESMVLRDRNHPSIILWSIGNEIPERGDSLGVATAKLLADYIRGLDDTRPITSAVNGLNPDKDPYFAQLDVAGYNYAAGGDHGKESIYREDHARVPKRIMVGLESYPLEAFGAWMDVVDNPYVIGDFVWTAFDYIGEASIGWLGYFQNQNFYPWNLAFCGDIDICGWKRPQSYYRDALWMDGQLSIFVKPPVPSFVENPKRESWSKWHWLDAVSNWNWAGNENTPIEVTAYSSCATTELFLNGKSLGKKPTNRASKYMASWQVPYQPGELKVIGYDAKNKMVNNAILKTATEVTQIKLTSDRQAIKADNQDLVYITVELLDANGNRNPLADNAVEFSVDGPASIAGVGNANPRSLEGYQQPKRNAWQGRCLVILKAGKSLGKISLTANVAGMKPVSISIDAVPLPNHR
ncbi:glycoside hydrolase family 2 TIM barrel-domain containing protein [soil metagenome]